MRCSDNFLQILRRLVINLQMGDRCAEYRNGVGVVVECEEDSQWRLQTRDCISYGAASACFAL